MDRVIGALLLTAVSVLMVFTLVKPAVDTVTLSLSQSAELLDRH